MHRLQNNKKTLLHNASNKNLSSVMDALIKAEANISIQDKDQNTQQLVELIKSEKSEEFDVFLEQHKPFNDHFYLRYNTKSLIYIAIQATNANAAIKLIEIIGNIDKKYLNVQYYNKTLLHYASNKNLSSVMDALIKAEANISIQDKDQNTQQLVELIKSKNSEEFDDFLEQHKPFNDHFYLDYKNRPLIYIAMQAKNEHAAIKLIKSIGDIDKKHLHRKYNCKTLLDHAKSNDLPSVMDALRKTKVDELSKAEVGISVQDKDTQQLVELIKSKNSEEFDEFLEQHKPFNYYFNLDYKTQPLIYIAIQATNANAAIKLIEIIGSIDKKYLHRKYDKKTFLHHASIKNLSSVVNALINAEVYSSIQDQYGRTTLDIANKKGHLHIADLLESEQLKLDAAEIELNLSPKEKNVLYTCLDSACSLSTSTSNNRDSEYQTQLIGSSTSNEDTSSIIASNDSLTQNTTLNDDQPSELDSLFKPIEEEQQASFSNNLCSAIDTASTETLYNIVASMSEELGDSPTINTNNKRPHSNIDTQNNSELNSLNYNANKRTDTHPVKPLTSLNDVYTKQRNDTDLIIAMSF